MRPAESSGIFEAPFDRRAFEGRQLGEDLRLIFLVEVLDDVNGLVGIELLERLGDLLRRHLLQHLVAHAFVELGQRRGIEVAPEHLDQRLALIGSQQLDQIGEVCFMQRQRQRAHRVGVAELERRVDVCTNSGRSTPSSSRKRVSPAASCIRGVRSNCPKGPQAEAGPPERGGNRR